LNPPSDPTARLGLVCLGLLVAFAVARPALVGGADLSQLPPAAATPVDFARDIRPILESSCLRCHGPEKPKNHFRLDSRPSALKGGDDGRDILPGNSAQSPLIQYVAHFVEDSEMPPLGKGAPLTAPQISLLRAWIDQGVVWDTTPPTNSLAFSLTPLLGGTTVSGDQSKFRELSSQPDGLYGGVEQFELFQQTSPDTKLLLTGHALLDNYKIGLSVDRNELGFIHSGWEQFRTWFDDTGGYEPTLIQPAPSLGRDLHLDTGKAWIDFGLTLPDWPQLVLGYEYDYQQGNEATTEWSAVGASPGTARNLAPASEHLNEGVHILKFDLDDEIKGVAVEERFRGEFYHLSTGDTNVAFGPFPQTVSEGTTYFQGANTIRIEKKVNDWCFASGGYLYSKLNADSSFTMSSPALLQQTDIPRINLEQESHVGNLNALFGPFADLVISTGVQADWTRQDGFGAGTFDQETPPPPFTSVLIPFNVASDYDETSLRENAALRYSKIPFTSLFAEARMEQQNIGQFDQFSAPQDILNKAVFTQHTEFSSQLDDLRVGFSTSPWRSVSFSTHYRRTEDASQYDSDPLVQPVLTAYPTFIRSRDLLTDEVEAKLVLHPSTRFKTTLSYQYHDDEYAMCTAPYNSFGNVISPGGQLIAGEDHSHIYSLSETLTPTPRLFLSTTVSYETSTLMTAANGSPAVVPDAGDIYTVLGDGTCVLSQSTDLFASYAFSEANYGQNNYAGGLPLGAQYQRHSAQIGFTCRFGKHVTAKLQYRFDYYDEPSSGGAANYRAQSVFGLVTFRFW
jgi:hypothetical protein